MNAQVIRLLYIEDHPVMIRGIRDIFRSSRDAVCLVASAENVETAIKTILPDQFDVIILDLFLGDSEPGMNISQLQSYYTNKPIIIYTSHSGIRLMKEAFQLGIKAWIVKTAEKHDIKETITKVFNGETIFPQELMHFHEYSGEKRKNVSLQYKNFIPTKEQLNILAWLCEGSTTDEIATKHLRMTQSTVEKKIQAMRELAEVNTNVELIVWYLRHYGQNS